MMQVWLLFKGIETIIGTACMYNHAMGFLDSEPLPHIMLFCGTFFGFTFLSFISAIGIAVGNAPPPLIECILNLCGAVMYFMSSIVSMFYAENDFHLMYLSDFEEPLHPFFNYCRTQSICALVAGAVHLLHSLLSFDALLITRSDSMQFDFDYDSEPEETYDSDKKRPLRLYFLGKNIEMKLRKNEWFDNLCQRENPKLSIHSEFRKYRLSTDSHRMKSFREGTREMGLAFSGSVSIANMRKLNTSKSVMNVTSETPPNTLQLATKKKDSTTDTEEFIAERLEKPIIEYLSEKPQRPVTTDQSSSKKVQEQSTTGDLDASQSAERLEKTSRAARIQPILKKAEKQDPVNDLDVTESPGLSKITSSHYLSPLPSSISVIFDEPQTFMSPTPAPSPRSTFIQKLKSDDTINNSQPTPGKVVNVPAEAEQPDAPSVDPATSETKPDSPNTQDVQDEPLQNQTPDESASISANNKEEADKKPKPESDPPK